MFAVDYVVALAEEERAKASKEKDEAERAFLERLFRYDESGFARYDAVVRSIHARLPLLDGKIKEQFNWERAEAQFLLLVLGAIGGMIYWEIFL